MQGHDKETRERLLSTAERLFAERGFSKVTIREICKSARANVAAVNYHFNGKKGLYDEVVRSAIKTMQSTTDLIRETGTGQSADAQLATYISIFLKRVIAARDYHDARHDGLLPGCEQVIHERPSAPRQHQLAASHAPRRPGRRHNRKRADLVHFSHGTDCNPSRDNKG